MRKQIFFLVFFCLTLMNVFAQFDHNPGSNHGNRFEQLDFLLPGPNEYRTASGAPGPKYWQQKADYTINASIDEEKNILTGAETVTYYNNSPDILTYLWLQLDENFHNAKSDNNRDRPARLPAEVTDRALQQMNPDKWLEGYGMNIISLTDAAGKSLKYTINQTMLRIDLPGSLKPGQKFVFKVNWNYKINNKAFVAGRGGYENFPEDNNNLYSIAQWFPRMAVYSDFTGWQHLQFAGGSEFALTFGNYKVSIDVPSDHIVAATGVCQNYKSLLTPAQYQRWEQAQSAKEPLEIVTLAEATEALKHKSTSRETWVFEADNVRDFAFNSSRRFVWDAMPVYIDGKKVMCMSYYGKEAYPIYKKYSTKATAHTLKVYSKHTIPYPYPVAQSVEAANGMEYPMLAMNYGRAEADGTYSEAIKYGAIGVIIHEVGHNFFPMIVNSDERQWWWMDEGLNTFCQFLAEQEFDNNYPSKRGPVHLITDYMKLPKDMLEPIMTKGDALASVGSNAYAKAATGLNILRETVMGRELFDFSFREYAHRWAFKHPTPADLFRTMEDASAVDLDWYWRGWYFGTDPVDISIDSVKWFQVLKSQESGVPNTADAPTLGMQRNKQDTSIRFYTDADTTLRDYYYYNHNADASLQEQDKEKLAESKFDNENANQWSGKHIYELTFSNRGGMIMPVIVEFSFKDGTKEVDRLPVTIWRSNENQFTKVFIKNKEVVSIRLDPYRETADINPANGMWPVKEMPSKFRLYKGAQAAPRGAGGTRNAMQNVQR